MIYKLPYYMVYPFPYDYDEEHIRERDRAYVQSLYPVLAKTLLPYVEEEMDRLEYKGSMIYDEYPDKLLLRLLCSRVHQKAESAMQEEIPRELTEILVYQELCRRRANRRSSIR